ncbi:type II CAAX endopeptidase family protein [Solibacillus sp. CAU 1738]|uniref:CPBP family intramembrane glutamic endopeptidase n=1 Tax=Solibacillus sp. CAU 1738 TaxID=3140363 RepID=UPI00325FE73B
MLISEKLWGWKELVLLLVITLVIVPVAIETYIQKALFQLLENPLYSGTITGAIMAIIFTLSIYMIALKPKGLSMKAVGLSSFSKGYWKWIVWWLFVHISLSIVILILMDIFNISWENSKTQSLQMDMTWFNITIAFISAAIISPIYEEIFYRGFLYKWLRGKWGITVGLFVSSTIFMIVHIPTYNTLPVNFITGMICAWTYEKTSSIWPAIIIHASFNGIALILTTLN